MPVVSSPPSLETLETTSAARGAEPPASDVKRGRRVVGAGSAIALMLGLFGLVARQQMVAWGLVFPGPVNVFFRLYAFHEALLRPLSTDAGAFLLERQLERVVSPTTVVWCAQDQILDVSSVETFKARLPEARTVVLDGCGHMPMMEAPQAVAAAILETSAKD